MTWKHLVFPQPGRKKKCTHSHFECPVEDFLFLTRVVTILQIFALTPVHKQNIENCPFEFQGPLGKNAHAHTPAGPAQRRLPREALTNNLCTNDIGHTGRGAGVVPPPRAARKRKA